MSYRTVTCTIRQVRKDSIMVEVPNRHGWQPIARSLVHGGDEIEFNSMIVNGGVEHTFRVMEWIAEKLGLAE